MAWGFCVLGELSVLRLYWPFLDRMGVRSTTQGNQAMDKNHCDFKGLLDMVVRNVL
jgi:hypothetical protein